MTTTQSEPTWEELLGANNWDGLLDPLDLALRKLILRCGDFCQVTYDAFNSDQNSKYCGASRYGKSSIFRAVFFPNASSYDVVSFLYATARISVPEALLLHSRSRDSWDRESNWMGYIAVTTDSVSRSLSRREIHVAWRGTIRDYEWINVLGADQDSAKPLLNKDSTDHDAKVMRGWLTIYTSNNLNSPFVKTSARVQLLTRIKQLVEKYKQEKLSVVISGHSLGAALAVLSAFDLVENGVVSESFPVTAFVFGCPQVGNEEFKEIAEKHRNLKILHTKNTIDLIPHYPGMLFGFVDMGEELVIDSRKSPHLNESLFPGDWHNLQGMLHVVAGWNGGDKEFEMKVKRSFALVNKSSGFLKDDYLVPESWWAEKNKGMVLDESSGEWILAPPDDEDLPVPEF
ncbi:Phospholipase A1-IIdelta [Morus notabilis]|uniref:Phospholipase A1 n=1 Tax=Morus notabilis TaxID=981085 RepID=W9SD02_9ROSA|nr:phospholipase A1-IIdelta [Morus notabilis]EXC00251.1 Phospholipase A1-IIdelta [Morus notabilis]